MKLALRFRYFSAIILVAVIAGCWYLIQITPTSFVPSEDQGIVRMSMTLPEGASFNRTESETEKVRKEIEAEIPGPRERSGHDGL